MSSRQQTALSFAIILFLIWLFVPTSGDIAGQQSGPSLSEVAARRLAKYRHALEALNGSSWGDFAPPLAASSSPAAPPRPSAFANITGFRDIDGIAWDDLDLFREKSLQLSRYAVSSDPQQLPSPWDTAEGEPVWSSAAGSTDGEWVLRPGSLYPRAHDDYNLSRSVPGIEWTGGDRVDWGRNLTGSSGRIHLRVDEDNNRTTVAEYEQLPRDQAPLSGGSIRAVSAVLSLEDTVGSGSTWEMRLSGVHWPRQGVVMMTTTSEKFDGIFGLPHLTPAPDFFDSSRTLLLQHLDAVLDMREKRGVDRDQSVPWSSEMQNNPQYLLSPAPQCEYVMYAQIHPLERDHLRDATTKKNKDDDNLNMSRLISAIEDELASPQGAPVGYIPRLRISAVLYSPDCAFFVETKGPPQFSPGEANHLVGVKAEVQTHRIRMWLLVFASIVFCQVFLLKNQIKNTCTPSTVGRVSFGTVSVMVIVDGTIFVAAATWVSSAGATLLPTMALMLAAFLSMAIGGNFLAKIHEVQFPENHPRTETLGNMMAPTAATSASGPLLPGPVTASTGYIGGGVGSSINRSSLPPVIVPLDGDVDADTAEGAAAVTGLGASRAAPAPSAAVSPRQNFQSIIGRFVLTGLVLGFVTVSSSTWYPSVRGAYLDLCALAYLSLWAPQIRRNAVRNSRRALGWPFVLGQSALRLAPVAYFWLDGDNVLFARTAPRAFVAVAAWLWIQLAALAAQDALGPRFAVPRGWLPDAWDYHPVLREGGSSSSDDDLEAGAGSFPIGLLSDFSTTWTTAEEETKWKTGGDDEAGTRQRRGSGSSAAAADGSSRRRQRTDVRVIDCSICQEALEVPIVRAGGNGDVDDNDDVAAGGGGGDDGVAGMFARRQYMLTPCRHIFHTTCLESWMRFRLQCPICREDLPPR